MLYVRTHFFVLCMICVYFLKKKKKKRIISSDVALLLCMIWIELIVAETENWKYCSKIIFKYVNSTVRPILIFFSTWIVLWTVMNSTWIVIFVPIQWAHVMLLFTSRKKKNLKMQTCKREHPPPNGIDQDDFLKDDFLEG